MPTTCTIPNCTRPHKSKGLCTLHYTRLRRHGDPNHVKKPGRHRDPHRQTVEAVLGEDFGSRRTIERYHRALRIPATLAHYGIITDEKADSWAREAIAAATRPNGTINVSRLLERIEDLAAIALFDASTNDDG